MGDPKNEAGAKILMQPNPDVSWLYANHTVIQVGQDDVIFVFCRIEPPDTMGSIEKVDAKPLVKVQCTRNHARKIAELVLAQLK